MGLGLCTHLFVKYLDQETAKEPFRSSSQAATCYYQANHSKVEAIPLSALPKDTTSELVTYLLKGGLEHLDIVARARCDGYS